MRLLRLVAVCILITLPDSLIADEGDEASAVEVVYPKNTPLEQSGNASTDGPYSDLLGEGGTSVGMVVTVFGYIIIFGGLAVVAWFLFKRGVIRKPFSNNEGKLKVSESRMLGNRQYIMVVEYEDNKILLGVGPGKIDYLTSLNGYRNDFPNLEAQVDKRSIQEIA